MRADALEYLAKLRDAGTFSTGVLFVGAMVDSPSDGEGAPSLERYKGQADDLYRALPNQLTVRWLAWIGDGSSVPRSHIHYVEGIPVAAPGQVLSGIGERELILDQGDLRFEPEFGEFQKPGIES